jgi:hypothetical protein
MIELDSTQLRRMADALDSLGRIERESGVQVVGHRGGAEITVPPTADGDREQVLDLVRRESRDGAEYLLRVGD